jgi:hypothetical protein
MKHSILVVLAVVAVAAPAVAQQASTQAIGGYAPVQPALQGTPQPGSPVVFQPSPSPEQAFPPPPPQAHYPPCRHGQRDECIQLNDPR